VTAFFERIAEHPAICDPARGADIIESLTKALGASPGLAPVAKLLRNDPKVRDLAAGALTCALILRRSPSAILRCSPTA
jgi:hypothetical protein